MSQYCDAITRERGTVSFQGLRLSTVYKSGCIGFLLPSIVSEGRCKLVDGSMADPRQFNFSRFTFCSEVCLGGAWRWREFETQTRMFAFSKWHIDGHLLRFHWCSFSWDCYLFTTESVFRVPAIIQHRGQRSVSSTGTPLVTCGASFPLDVFCKFSNSSFLCESRKLVLPIRCMNVLFLLRVGL